MLTYSDRRFFDFSPFDRRQYSFKLLFSLYNDLSIFKDAQANLLRYNEMISPEQRASACIECEKCEEQVHSTFRSKRR
jgi:hypothetical protein